MSAAGNNPEEGVMPADRIASCLTRQEEELTCPVCRDIFKNPVILSCSHSFCKACLQKWWTGKPTWNKGCPVCKTNSSQDEPPSNLALKNLCENFLEERSHISLSARSEVLCTLHGEKLRLFCLDDAQLTCLVCRDSEKHTGHKFRPIYESAKSRKEDLQKSLKPLQEKLEDLHCLKANYIGAVECIKVQALHTETQIKKQFENIRQFLSQEEEDRISALREEERQKSQMTMDKIEGLSREMATLAKTIRDVEADDIPFLQNYETTVEIVQLTLQDTHTVSGALIDVAKHLGNLTFRVWDKMKDIVAYTPVILDPNTSNADLNLSHDLTSLLSDDVELHDNSERLEYPHNILGSEGFNSGTHSWDVEVGNNNFWELGVLSFQRKGDNGHKGMMWCLGFVNGRYTASSSTGSGIDISVNQKPSKIRVHLDWGRGELSFSDPDSNTHILTFAHTFTRRLFPFISTYGHLPLKVLPGKVSVTLGHHS